MNIVRAGDADTFATTAKIRVIARTALGKLERAISLVPSKIVPLHLSTNVHLSLPNDPYQSSLILTIPRVRGKDKGSIAKHEIFDDKAQAQDLPRILTQIKPQAETYTHLSMREHGYRVYTRILRLCSGNCQMHYVRLTDHLSTDILEASRSSEIRVFSRRLPRNRNDRQRTITTTRYKEDENKRVPCSYLRHTIFEQETEENEQSMTAKGARESVYKCPRLKCQMMKITHKNYHKSSKLTVAKESRIEVDDKAGSELAGPPHPPPMNLDATRPGSLRRLAAPAASPLDNTSRIRSQAIFRSRATHRSSTSPPFH
ncbi:hypothetical protein SISNIDRAFT_526475 [Sistotremastrum niveocremeum HHB9708]|uniref:Uncharacterized protein n=1 Tax=Sistotremastrum niveocremeum HHB9708 TaxID=1314777 RepID=A0A164QGN4_9AGAM|nr:hypothetical protein SISNIDRAFT_526475 [Sistotremastrum niveocremeum HHB9708]